MYNPLIWILFALQVPPHARGSGKRGTTVPTDMQSHPQPPPASTDSSRPSLACAPWGQPQLTVPNLLPDSLGLQT